MTSILVVDDDDVLRLDVVKELSDRGYQVIQSGDVPGAIAQLTTNQPDILLTDLRMDGGDGVDLLVALREVSPDTLPILMSGFATARDYQRATDLGAVKVLTKPFTPKELLNAVEHAIDCGSGFRGSVHGVSLVDMLQMFHFGRRTIALHIASAEPSVIEFRDGELVHASRGAHRGVEALREILATPTGAMSTSVPTGEITRSIEQPFSALLMDVLREVDEGAKSASPASEASGDESSLDAMFEEWVSIRPGAANNSDSVERWRALGPLLQRVAPGIGAAIIDETSARVISLCDFSTSLEWVPLMSELRNATQHVVQESGFCEIELIGRNVACALLYNAEEGYTLALDSLLLDRLAPQRFRSQVRQIVQFLPSILDNNERTIK